MSTHLYKKNPPVCTKTSILLYKKHPPVCTKMFNLTYKKPSPGFTKTFKSLYKKQTFFLQQGVRTATFFPFPVHVRLVLPGQPKLSRS